MKPESPFAVGEMAIYWRPGAPFHNTECQVVSELIYGPVRDTAPGGGHHMRECWYHQIDGNFGPAPFIGQWAAEVPHLRKKPGEGDLRLTDWSQCVFDPNRLIIKV